MARVLQRTDGNKDSGMNPSLISILRTSAPNLRVEGWGAWRTSGKLCAYQTAVQVYVTVVGLVT